MRQSCREHHNGHWSVTQAIHHMVISRSPFSSESALVFEAMLHNCLLGAADIERFMFVGYEAVTDSC